MSITVTPDNFMRAESDLYFSAIAVKDGGFGRFCHRRHLIPIENQNVIRENRDIVYSAAVFDLDAGPVTVTLPDTKGRFMSMEVLDEDQYVPFVFYDTLVTIRFGGCDGARGNCIPIVPGWNYMVRLYRPREEILSRTWVFPEARIV